MLEVMDFMLKRMALPVSVNLLLRPTHYRVQLTVSRTNICALRISAQNDGFSATNDGFSAKDDGFSAHK